MMIFKHELCHQNCPTAAGVTGISDYSVSSLCVLFYDKIHFSISISYFNRSHTPCVNELDRGYTSLILSLCHSVHLFVSGQNYVQVLCIYILQ